MRERLWIFFGLLLGFSFALQVAMPVDLSESPETSFETAPRGHAALFELLGRYESVRGRWLSGLTMPSTKDTIWWIAAPGICDGRADQDGDERSESGDLDAPFRFGVEPWIEAGGTAVVWLSHPPLHPEEPFEWEDTEEPDVPTREVAYRKPNFDRTAEGSLPGAEGMDPGAEGADPGADGSDSKNEGADPEDAEAIRDDWHDSLDETRREMREGAARRCVSVAGHALPPRRLAGLEGGELPSDADSAATVFSVGRFVDSREDFDYEAARTLPGATLAFFEAGSEAQSGWQPLWVEADDHSPFALERRIGEGRLIVAADARVLTNARLARVDSAPFVFDWVRDWGSPWIDEHHHGVVPESGTFRYVASSPARAACIGLLALGVLFVWRGHAFPKRRVEELVPEAPTLATFVDSLSRLYAGTADHASAFERYRALSLDRIRRVLGLSVGTPAEIVLASLRARAENRPALRERGIQDLLTKDIRVETAAELERAAARLDELVRVLGEENGRGGNARQNEL